MMARLCSQRLLVLFSLVSSSCTFLMRHAHVQDGSFRSRQTKNRNKGDDPLSVYRRLGTDDDRGEVEDVEVRRVSQDCKDNCGTFDADPPHSSFGWEMPGKLAGGRLSVSPNTEGIGRYLKHFKGVGKKHVPEDWITLSFADAFAYPKYAPFDTFSTTNVGGPKRYQLDNSVTKNDLLELDVDYSDQHLGPVTERDPTQMSGLHIDSADQFSIERDDGHSEKTDSPKPGSYTRPVDKRFRVPLRKKVFVYGRDDRLRVFLSQMRKFPFSNIARLSTGCTGTLVTPRHVLTAAHCVHNGLGFRNNLEKLKIEIPDTMGFKDYYAQKITIPTGWLRENRSRYGRRSGGRRAVYDYAVVRLKLAVTGRSKFLPLSVPRPEVLRMDFHFLAFPEDGQQMWRSVCLASQHMALGDGNLILTRCDAAVGNSGAAVFIQDPHEGLRVVGVLSNTMQVVQNSSFLRYSIITALTWPKLAHICGELGALGRKYNVCPPLRYMRRSHYPPANIQVIPFFGKRARSPALSRTLSRSRGERAQCAGSTPCSARAQGSDANGVVVGEPTR